MRVSFDRIADASYIKISNKKIKRTISVSDYCNIDIDENDRIVGIELLFVSEYMRDSKLWLGVEDVAEYLNKSPVTIRRWIQEKKIPSYKIGREYMFIKEELDDYIQKQRQA